MGKGRATGGAMRIFCIAIRFCLAGLFLLAGMTKLIEEAKFADSIAAFQIFPDWSINVFAMTVPVVEILSAVLLLSPWWRRQGVLLSFILSVVFVALISWGLMGGLIVKCSCFGALEFLGTGPHAGAIRASLMAAASGILYSFELVRQRRSAIVLDDNFTA
jgi:uncharacterized membrane protein YphA (DoxX/SURF4 family)